MKDIRKKVNIIAILLIIMLIQIPMIAKATDLESGTYIITDAYISKIQPETTIEEFKTSFEQQGIKVYQDANGTQEITSGYVGTNMYAIYNGVARKTSVIGDLNGDGKANQIDLSMLIRHVVGLANNQITDEERKESADLTGDLNINNADISAVIRYIVFGELTLETYPTPDITNINTEVTENSIKVTVATNNMDEGTYQYQYKKIEETRYTQAAKIKNNSYTITGLEANTKYTIKVKVINKYGRIEEKDVEVRTNKKEINIADSGVLEQNGEITWNNGKATIEFTTNTGQTIQYQINGTNGEWKTGNKVEGLNLGDKVYVRLWDGEEGSQIKEYTISDTKAPKVEVVTSGSTINSVTVTVKGTDNESGLTGNYTFYIKKVNEAESAYRQVQSSASTTLTEQGLEPNTDYVIKVEVEDKAGNKGNIITEIKTTGIPSAEETGMLEHNISWQNEKAKVELTTNTSYQIEWQKNSTTGTWEKGNTVTELVHGDKVYARLTDNTFSGKEKTILIEDKNLPTINEVSNSTTTNSVTLTVIATDNESGLSGNYAFYIKKTNESDSTYTLVQNTTSTTMTKDGLQQKTSYTIKVEVSDKAGNQASGTKVLVTEAMPTIGGGDSGNALIEKDGDTIWSNEKATVKLKTNTSYTIRYQVNGTTGTWEEGTTITDLKHGDTVYAVLWDGVNATNATSISVQDNEKPKISEESYSSTTGSVTLTVSAIDNESGLAGNYAFYIKKTGESDTAYQLIQDNTSSTVTKDGLDQTTSYTIKVEVSDKAGNKNTLTRAIETEAMPSVADMLTGTITWSDGEATVTLETTTEHTIQYQIGSVYGNWIEGSVVSSLDHNDVVYARLWDGSNHTDYITINIEDNDKPVITEVSNSTTTNSITWVVTATDDKSGLAERYAFYFKEAAEDDTSYTLIQNTASSSFTKEGLTDDTKYSIKVEVSDNVGNTETLTTTLETRAMPTINGETINELTGTVSWAGEKATVTFTTNTNHKIQYQRNSTDGKWIEGAIVTNVTYNDIIYARLWDGVNASNHIYVEIIDDEYPVITSISGSTTTNSLAVQVTATDVKSGIASYTFYLKKTTDNDSAYEKIDEGTNTSITKTGLEPNTSYTIKVEVKDNGGNVTTDTRTFTTQAIGDATDGLTSGNITATTAVWSNEKATITLSTTTDRNIEWQVNSISGQWTTGTTVENLNHNDTVYARLTDGTNAGAYGSVTITDSGNPTATISITPTSTNTSSSVTATVTQNDSQSGINLSACKWVYNTNSSSTIQESLYTGTFTTKPSENLTLNATTPGTYYLHVLTVDNAGHTIQTVSNAVTIKQMVTGITLNKTSLALKMGSTETLTATIKPSNATNQGVNWTTSNQAIAKVDSSGKITAVAVGTATIAATAQDGSGVKATCTVTVSYPELEVGLTKGKYVNYIDKSGTTRKCIVLYDSTSSYGIQIITTETVEDITFGSTTDWATGRSSYNNAISTLNNAASSYLNTTYATSARSVGSVPNNPSSQATTYYNGSVDWVNGTFLEADTNYETDYNQMKSLGITSADNAYWFASRDTDAMFSTVYYVEFSIRYSPASGGLGYIPILQTNTNGTQYKYEKTMRTKTCIYFKIWLKYNRRYRN